MKECTKCEVSKPLDEYSYANKAKGKLQPWCKECVAKRDKDSYSTDSRRISIRKAAQSSVARAKKYVDEYKAARKCVNCGDLRYYVLEFHHIGNKKYDISSYLRRGVSLETLTKEMDKCILLCANCHREYHHLERLKDGDVSPRTDTALKG